uniref:Phosphatidylglycerol--prolipoprotein diacylglyceryl transferase n=1 Tax=candidate division CPR3 bacterium TaxID=2268181 RepID=A0A7C4R4H1_UNCC3
MKKYVKKIKEKPEQLLFDILNTALLFLIFGILVTFTQWIVQVFSGNILINPLVSNLFGWQIYWYGMFFSLAFFFGFFVVIKEGKKIDKNVDHIISILFWTIIFGFIGARFVFVALNWNFYQNNLSLIFNIWQGGLSLYGGIAGGFMFLAIYSEIKKIRLSQLLDIFTFAVLIGQAIGRWGNLFNQEYLGIPSDKIKIYISPSNRPWEYRNQDFFHPLFLYESVFCFLLFVVLLFLRKTNRIKEGFVFLYFLLLYSAFRFLIGFLSFEKIISGGFNLVQIFSIIIFAISILMIIYKKIVK